MSDDTIDLTPAFESGDTVNFYDLLDTAYVVKLETSDECLIGGYPQYRIFDNYICAAERYSPSSTPVLFFDRNGKFVSSFKAGNGPGEIQGPAWTIVEDKGRDRLIVADYSGRLKFYDNDLNYTGDLENSDLFSGIAVAGDKFVLRVDIYKENQDWGENSDCKMILADSNLNVLDGYVHYVIPDADKRTCRAYFGSEYGTSNGNVYYHEFQWDTLYVYDTAFHALPINFPDKAKIDIAELTCENMNEFRQNIKGNYVDRIVQFDNYIIFYLNVCGILYEKSTKKAIKITSAPYMEIDYGNCFVESFGFENLERYKESPDWYGFKLSELKRVLSESDYAKLESLTEDDNPVLIFYQLKKTLE